MAIIPTGILKFDKAGRGWIHAFGVWFLTPLCDPEIVRAKQDETRETP